MQLACQLLDACISVSYLALQCLHVGFIVSCSCLIIVVFRAKAAQPYSMMASEHSCVCVYASAALVRVRVCECGLLYILFSFSSFLLASASSSRLALASMRSLDKLTLRDLRVLICLFICLLFENLFMMHGQNTVAGCVMPADAQANPMHPHRTAIHSAVYHMVAAHQSSQAPWLSWDVACKFYTIRVNGCC